MILRVAVPCICLALASPAFAAEIGCKAPFLPSASLVDIQKAYGKANVKTGQVDGPEGESILATTVFPKTPRKTFEVYWNDDDRRSGVASWTVSVDDTGPGGIKRGMSVADVEKINGAPFNLSGFYWDYGGSASFDTGKLANLPGGCYLVLTFNPTVENVSDKVSDAVSGDQQLSSDMAELKIVKPIVSEITLGYASDDAEDDTGSDGSSTDDSSATD